LLETDESTPTGTKTVVKYLLTKKNSNKNPCLAYVPLQHMVQDNDENELKQPNRQSDDQVCSYFLYNSFIDII